MCADRVEQLFKDLRGDFRVHSQLAQRPVIFFRVLRRASRAASLLTGDSSCREEDPAAALFEVVQQAAEVGQPHDERVDVLPSLLTTHFTPSMAAFSRRLAFSSLFDRSMWRIHMNRM